jgi:heat shock protein HtpX
MLNVFKCTLLLSLPAAGGVALALWSLGGGPLWLALLAVLPLGAIVLFGSAPLVLRLYRARRVDRSTAPHLTEVLNELCGRAGLPLPSLWIIDDAAPTAFAVGPTRRRAAVALTTGLLVLLDERELRAVLAHELAHIARRDTLVATTSAMLVGLLFVLGLLALGADEVDDATPHPAGAMLIALLAPLAGLLMRLWLEPSREFAADRLGAAICGDASALADALARIDRRATRVRLRAAELHPQTASLLVVPPGPAGGWFASHPATAERIARLRRGPTG